MVGRLQPQTRAPSGFTCVVAKANIETLHPMIVQLCLSNQSRKYWLFSDALYATFHINTKLPKGVWMEDACGANIAMWANGLRVATNLWSHGFESIEVIKPCFACVIDFTHEKAHNMLLLIID